MSQTIVDDPQNIDPTLQSLRQAYRTGKTRPLEFRKQQLKNLLQVINESTKELHEAMEADLGYRNMGVTNLLTISPVVLEIQYLLDHMEEWSKTQKVDTNLFVGPGSSYIVPEPFGVCLVIGSWNYPLFTGLKPAAMALAAGNCVCLKPSELAPHSSKLIKKLFEQSLDRDCYAVIEGGVEVAKAITTRPWDLIVFTGSPEKGKMIARAAAENLVPCILELGGKSPTVIDSDVKLESACMRIAQGKFSNAGQTCIAPDYVLVHQSIQEDFVKGLVNATKLQLSDKPNESTDYSQVVTPFHTQRLIDMINEKHGGKVVLGGDGAKANANERYFPPTIVVNPNEKSRIMTEEIFGPILPIITYQNFDEVIEYINDRPKPLALYYFGENKKNRMLLEERTSSGALSTNECVFHVLNHQLPFGGVGNSGYGQLNGKTGFLNCCHMKPVLVKGTLNSWPVSCRFPPYNDSKIKTMSFLGKFANVYMNELGRKILFFVVFVLLAYYANKFFLTGGQKGDL